MLRTVLLSSLVAFRDPLRNSRPVFEARAKGNASRRSDPPDPMRDRFGIRYVGCLVQLVVNIHSILFLMLSITGPAPIRARTVGLIDLGTLSIGKAHDCKLEGTCVGHVGLQFQI